MVKLSRVSTLCICALIGACGDAGDGTDGSASDTVAGSTAGTADVSAGPTGATSSMGTTSTTSAGGGSTSQATGGSTSAGASTSMMMTSSAETTTGTATDPATGSTGGNLKPPDAPDWIVVAVSGHCIPPGCELPGTNNEYLAKDGAAGRIADTLAGWGNSVEVWAYSDEFYNRDSNTAELLPGEGDPIYLGFLQLYEDLQFARDTWVADFEDPTRVLVVAHSHGVVWAHTALHVVDDLPVEFMIDFDGKSVS